MSDILNKETFKYYIEEAVAGNKIAFLTEVVTYARYTLKLEKAKKNPDYLKLWIKNAYNRLVINILYDINPEQDIPRKLLMEDSMRLKKKIKEIITNSHENGVTIKDIKRLAWDNYCFSNAKYIEIVRKFLRSISYKLIDDLCKYDRRYYTKEYYNRKSN